MKLEFNQGETCGALLFPPILVEVETRKRKPTVTLQIKQGPLEFRIIHIHVAFSQTGNISEVKNILTLFVSVCVIVVVVLLVWLLCYCGLCVFATGRKRSEPVAPGCNSGLRSHL